MTPAGDTAAGRGSPVLRFNSQRAIQAFSIKATHRSHVVPALGEGNSEGQARASNSYPRLRVRVGGGPNPYPYPSLTLP